MAGRLTNSKALKIVEPGRYGAGEPCLYLHVRSASSRQWLARVRFNNRRYDIHIGPFPLYTLDEAVELTRSIRKAAFEGQDPRFVLKKQGEVPTFAEAGRRVWEMNRDTWRNQKHAAQWLSTLETYAFPRIGGLRIDSLETRHVLEVLEPIWLEKSETARRVKQRLGTVFDWARAAGYIATDPMSGILKALPKQTTKPVHHAALPWRDLPDFMSDLRQRDGVSARCLEFIILTAARSGEARKATWSEIDFDKRLWTVPAERMKAGRQHVVPLSDRAVEVLQRMRGLRTDCDELIFPGARQGRPLSDMAFKALFKRMGSDDLTAHGFRSTFRDWVAEATTFPREVAEHALAHRVGNAVERSYARSTLLDQRNNLMKAWEEASWRAPVRQEIPRA